MISDLINRDESGTKYSFGETEEEMRRLPRLRSGQCSATRQVSDLINRNENGAKYSFGETEEEMRRLPRLRSRNQSTYVHESNELPRRQYHHYDEAQLDIAIDVLEAEPAEMANWH
eukprot:CFRG3333T1